MKNRIGIIDLGTNTCNLLVAEYQNSDFQILFQGKEVVKLGKNGIDKNLLTEDGLDRAVLAINKHKEKITSYQVKQIEVIATSAIREASNNEWFKKKIKDQTGLNLTIISGEKEADLIFKGVKLAFNHIEDQSIILDIGGGSNEFILTQDNVSIWKQSFPLGMARIIELMPPSDPITEIELNRITEYFNSKLTLLWNQTINRKISSLIGCSGAFDTLADLIDQTDPGTKTRISQEINLNDFERLYRMLIKSTTEERTKMKGMESIRIEMIVPSVLFIKLIIDKLNIKKIHQTDFALREGVLFEQIFS